ncbi:MAG: phosphoribosylamine--glycine ligase [Treponema sp.]|jgi:phosphoribosylamine--glycine ligase|nr:phosphoribosylamine--glycine ligase [Treponema sp.]
MKILVIGSGGREHAMAWKLAQPERVSKVWVAPGNGGTAAEAKCANVPAGLGDPSEEAGQQALIGFARREGIALTVVGPEVPLAEGMVDRFRAAGLAIVGPGKQAARLEASKGFSKAFMARHGVRAARSETFADFGGALGYAREHFAGGLAATQMPLVVKADGLAAGKGVVIAADLGEAKACLASFMYDGSLGAAGSSVVLEEFLTGREVSALAAVSVRPGAKGTIKPFIPARDHKRRFDGGLGPNTGGMGAVAPASGFSAAAREDFDTAILQPTLRGMEAEGMDYRGFIFFGLMVRDDRCYLLEYNARLGDPETQAVLPLMDADFPALCAAILDGSLADFPLNWKSGAVCAPVAVAGGYPGPYRRGDAIHINEAALAKTGAQIFVAGANRAGQELRTAGGRVLAASAWGADGEAARENAYAALGAVSFEGMAYRKDIGLE